MIYVGYAAIALLAFLIIVNGFLLGLWKRQIDAVLGLLLTATVVMIFIFRGWQYGLFGIGLAFVTAIIARRLLCNI